MDFISPSSGRLCFDEVFRISSRTSGKRPIRAIRSSSAPTPSLAKKRVSSPPIIVHREGKGARYYYTRERERIQRSLRQRIFYETARSLGLGR